jgi:formamidopyrimidine-DNA glycosylase
MPELPEVETVRLAISKVVNKALIEKVDIFRYDLRWKIKDDLKIELEKDFFKTPFRLGKYILIPTNKENVLLIHLGMSGQIKIQNKKYEKTKHDHINIVVKTECDLTYNITYNDPRRFGFIDLFKKKDIHKHFLLNKLGVEALGRELTVSNLKPLFINRKKSIKNTLIDQTVIAGIGNIYASEILYKAKIHPFRSTNSLSEIDLESIIKACRFILKKAIKLGGTTIKNHAQPDGKLGYFKQKLKVYGRAGKKCFNCKNNILNNSIANRSTYYCDYCQI